MISSPKLSVKKLNMTSPQCVNAIPSVVPRRHSYNSKQVLSAILSDDDEAHNVTNAPNTSQLESKPPVLSVRRVSEKLKREVSVLKSPRSPTVRVSGRSTDARTPKRQLESPSRPRNVTQRLFPFKSSKTGTWSTFDSAQSSTEVLATPKRKRDVTSPPSSDCDASPKVRKRRRKSESSVASSDVMQSASRPVRRCASVRKPPAQRSGVAVSRVLRSRSFHEKNSNGESDMETSVSEELSPPPKRTTATPKKTPRVDRAKTADAEGASQTTTPGKRGRGRPPKTPNAQNAPDDEEEATSCVTPAKRGPGRPPRTPNTQKTPKTPKTPASRRVSRATDENESEHGPVGTRSRASTAKTPKTPTTASKSAKTPTSNARKSAQKQSASECPVITCTVYIRRFLVSCMAPRYLFRAGARKSARRSLLRDAQFNAASPAHLSACDLECRILTPDEGQPVTTLRLRLQLVFKLFLLIALATPTL